MYEDEPQDRVHDFLADAVFGEHPLGRRVLGEADVIASIPIPEIECLPPGPLHGAEHRRRRRRAPRPRADRRARRSGWSSRRGSSNGAAADSAAPPTATSAASASTQKDTEQYHICFGAPGITRDDERRFALAVLDSIFGGSTSSRLFREIREKRGLAYAVGSYNEQYTDSGLVATYIGTRADNVEEACSIIGARARAAAFGARLRPMSCSRAKEHVKGRLVLSSESTAARMTRIGRATLFDLPIFSLDEMLERVDAVTVDDLQELAVPALPRGRPLGRLHRAERGSLPQGPGAGQRGAGGLMIRVAVSGAAGRMGQAVVRGGRGCRRHRAGRPRRPLLGVPLDEVLDGADVVVDFTTPDAAPGNVRRPASMPGCTRSSARRDSTSTRCEAAAEGSGGEANCFVAPNFAIGAVLMMQAAQRIAPHMPECEIVELHHDRKLDAPSGNAKRTAELIREAGGNVHEPIHSVRLPGLVAHQEVIFGGEGQTLTIRHDSIDRRSFMPGVLLAVRRVGELPDRFTVGLETAALSGLGWGDEHGRHSTRPPRRSCALGRGEPGGAGRGRDRAGRGSSTRRSTR